LVKGSQETGIERARAYRSLGCLSLEMVKGMSTQQVSRQNPTDTTKNRNQFKNG